MKKIIIGSVFMLSGIIISMGIIIAAVIYLPSINGWSGSKLWFAIFGAEAYGNQVSQSLFLGLPFSIGIILSITGLVILLKQYFHKED